MIVIQEHMQHTVESLKGIFNPCLGEEEEDLHTKNKSSQRFIAGKTPIESVKNTRNFAHKSILRKASSSTVQEEEEESSSSSDKDYIPSSPGASSSDDDNKEDGDYNSQESEEESQDNEDDNHSEEEDSEEESSGEESDSSSTTTDESSRRRGRRNSDRNDDDDSSDDDDDSDGGTRSKKKKRRRMASNMKNNNRCFLCDYCTSQEVRFVTGFIADNIANMEVGLMAEQIRKYIFEKRPEYATGHHGLEVLTIRKHIREHMLSPTVRIADMMRHLLKLCDTLRGNLEKIDPDTGESTADRSNIDTYLKVVTKVLDMYKMSETNKMLFANTEK